MPGKSYVVAGGARGIGHAIAARLAGEDGAHVVVLDGAEPPGRVGGAVSTMIDGVIGDSWWPS